MKPVPRGVGSGLGVEVGLGVAEGQGVGLGVGVLVGVSVGVEVRTGLGVKVGLGVRVGLGLRVGVRGGMEVETRVGGKAREFEVAELNIETGAVSAPSPFTVSATKKPIPSCRPRTIKSMVITNQ